jgi:DNA-binding SARP family transcriptional activator
MLSWLGRWTVRASAGSVLLATIAGVPAWLTLAVGWPLPRTIPSQDALVAFVNGGVTDRMVVNVLAVAIWLVWALFAQAVIAEIRDTARGVKDLHPRSHRNPLRTAASLLISSMLLGSVLAATAATASPAPARATTATPVAAVQTAALPSALSTAAQGPTIVHVGNNRYVYTVKRGDYLSKIAKVWLGDADRWPEICDLNWHRHFPKVGGTLRDCNLIYPGWDLRLPADAKPPAGATPVKPPATPPVVTPTPSTAPSSPPVTPSPSIAPSPSITVSPGVDSPVIVPSGVPSTAPVSPSPVTSASASPSPVTSSPVPSESASASPAASDSEGPAVISDEHGVQLSPSSWMPWGLALAIAAAAMLVWLQRRRRFTGQPDDDPLTELPEPVVKLRRALARHSELARADDDADTPALVPDLAPLPPGGAGLTGEGALAAARAALVAVLASGGPHHPDARGEVVIDAATLATLLGPDVVTLGVWPRLHVADSAEDALMVIESRLLHRARILDENALTDLDELRQRVPDEEALPPVMLITETPPAGARMQAKAALALGGDGLQVTGLLLGEWAHGATIEVAPDGHTKLVAGHTAEPVPARLPVLDPDTAIQILTTLREAQTGEPPAIVSPAVPVTVVALHASRVTPAVDEPQLPADVAAAPVTTAGPVNAKLRVLGSPRIEDIVHEGRPLRGRSLELAVYLAVHPDGVSVDKLKDVIALDAHMKQASDWVHQAASNLRHVLGRAAVPAESAKVYVLKGGGRYKLDAERVDVDVWTLRDLMRKATLASGPARRELLAAACDLYTAPLADGEEYEWLAPHRETVRRWGTEAHLQLADALLDDHRPQEASDLLDKAIGLDRYNEALYVRAMHARHALGDADGIRTLLRALTKALADLDAEPQDDTRAVAAKLRTSLEQQ